MSSGSRAYDRLGRRLSLPDLQIDLVQDSCGRLLHLWRASEELLRRPPERVQIERSGWTASGRCVFEGPAVAGEDLLAILDAYSGRSRSRDGASRDPVGLSGPLPLDAALALTFHACIALRQRGEAHGRLSPLTVLVGHDGRVEVTPRLFAELIDDGLTSYMSDVTRRFAVRARYLSPEAAAGRTVDRRSDVFSLGCMLHELATGRDPLPGATDYQRILRSLQGETALCLPDPYYPEEVAEVVARALRPDPAERYESPIELARAIRAAATATGTSLSTESLRQLMERLFLPELSLRSALPRPDALAVTSYFCAPIEVALAAAIPVTPYQLSARAASAM